MLSFALMVVHPALEAAPMRPSGAKPWVFARSKELSCDPYWLILDEKAKYQCVNCRVSTTKGRTVLARLLFFTFPLEDGGVRGIARLIHEPHPFSISRYWASLRLSKFVPDKFAGWVLTQS